jgi:hypothetical protein
MRQCIFVHTRGSIKSVQESRLKNGVANFFDINELGMVFHSTFLTVTNNRYHERYVKYQNKKLKLSIHTDKDEYGRRKK